MDPPPRHLALHQLHAIYHKLEYWEIYDGKNPADRVREFPTRSRCCFVQPHEMPYLLKALAEEWPQTETFFLTLLLTGARVGEARSMRWQDLDFERALWHKPMTKTEGRTPSRSPHSWSNGSDTSHTSTACRGCSARVRMEETNLPPGWWSTTAVSSLWRRIRKQAGNSGRANTRSPAHGRHLARLSEYQPHHDSADAEPFQIGRHPVYARFHVEPLRQALDQHAERMLGGPARPAVEPAPAAEQAETQDHRRMEWPG